MAIVGSYTQQPADNLDYDIPYELAAGDSLISVVDTVTPVGLGVISLVVGNKVKLWVSGGTNGTTYKIEFTATSAQGRIKQDEIRIRIRDK